MADHLGACLLGTFITAQGPMFDPLPNCMAVCKPQIAGDGSIGFVCELICTVDEADLDFANAMAAGDPYMPRFTHPSGCTAACGFGDGQFTLTTITVDVDEYVNN